ncbi:NAD(P)H-binding protein [Candidatus Pelagibacter sp.]|nr:NAD(P)H-binding protein [Candidatus Pelagibacter sp.]
MKTALIFGSSGLVGGQVLNKLIDNSNYSTIKIFVRSEPKIQSNKVEIIKTDFSKLENFKKYIKGDDCFFCIGTTRKKSPNHEEYRRIEFDIPKQIAHLAKLNEVKSFIFISSISANPKSTSDYLKFKGQVEEEIQNLNFSKVAIMRPSFLMGKRNENRIVEKLGIPIFNFFSPLFLGSLKKMKPINSEIVAKIMIKAANEDLEKIIFESDEMSKLNLDQT